MSTRHSGLRRIVRVTVYPDADSMRRAARRYNEPWMDSAPQFTKALGICHAVDIRQIGADGSEKRSPVAAHIRLCEQAIGTGVVTHEVTHAAMAIYNQDCLERDGTVHEDLPQEETLCYLVGDLTARIVNKMYEFGYYGKGENA